MKANSLTESMQKEVNERLWRFVEQHGGTQTVAKKVGITVQTMYNIRDNRSFPAGGTLASFKRAYPNLNINMFLSVEETEITRPALADQGIDLLRQQLEQAQAQINKLQQRNEKLENDKDLLTMALLEKTHPNLFADKPGVKIGSDCHLTEAAYLASANVPFVSAHS